MVSDNRSPMSWRQISTWGKAVAYGYCLSLYVSPKRASETIPLTLHRLEHPFLLADNRHYPHIFWRRVVRRFSWSRWLLVEVYAQSINHIVGLLCEYISPFSRFGPLTTGRPIPRNFMDRWFHPFDRNHAYSITTDRA